MVWKETFCATLAKVWIAHKRRKAKSSSKHGPTEKRAKLSFLLGSQAEYGQEIQPEPEEQKESVSTRSKLSPSPPSPTSPRHWPFYAEWFEESESDEVSSGGSEGPEEVLPQVSLLQGEVLVGFQAGAHLRRRVDVLFPQGLLAKVFVLGWVQSKEAEKGHELLPPKRNRDPSNEAQQVKSSQFAQHRRIRDGRDVGRHQTGQCWIPGGYNFRDGTEKHHCLAL